jgi:hypothetical protein
MKHPLAEERFGRTFSGAEEFVSWANENGYDYAVEDLKQKFWSHEPDEYSSVDRGSKKGSRR